MGLVKVDGHIHKVIRKIIRYPNGYVEHNYCPICGKVVKTEVYVNDVDGWKKKEGVNDF